MVDCYLVRSNLNVSPCEKNATCKSMNLQKQQYVDALTKIGSNRPDDIGSKIDSVETIEDLDKLIQTTSLSKHSELYERKPPSTSAESLPFLKSLKIALEDTDKLQDTNISLKLDLQLLGYVHTKVYMQINSAIQKHFSKPDELSEDDEIKYCDMIGLQLEFIKYCENLIGWFCVVEKTITDELAARGVVGEETTELKDYSAAAQLKSS
ncbi:hypothetical protein CANARDRAFT_29142 [[Candida] arabinofermentans NRRL YB-2248]|uniref:Uncharacterized protein n=1 Tax=[Candida] arabinofermentans NRRL YB-2248 TaxID=983967 RepID=A0A1E4SYM3_9ASCO|nr:hypothetical protein CANARDRAFT_29142 [[Candida] arabinofermentans NRRL YB-2248]